MITYYIFLPQDPSLWSSCSADEADYIHWAEPQVKKCGDVFLCNVSEGQLGNRCSESSVWESHLNNGGFGGMFILVLVLQI